MCEKQVICHPVLPFTARYNKWELKLYTPCWLLKVSFVRKWLDDNPWWHHHVYNLGTKTECPMQRAGYAVPACCHWMLAPACLAAEVWLKIPLLVSYGYHEITKMGICLPGISDRKLRKQNDYQESLLFRIRNDILSTTNHPERLLATSNDSLKLRLRFWYLQLKNELAVTCVTHCECNSDCDGCDMCVDIRDSDSQVVIECTINHLIRCHRPIPKLMNTCQSGIQVC